MSLLDQTLTIKGEKKQEKEGKGEHDYRAERSYRTFARTIRLPVPVDGSQVTVGSDLRRWSTSGRLTIPTRTQAAPAALARR